MCGVPKLGWVKKARTVSDMLERELMRRRRRSPGEELHPNNLSGNGKKGNPVRSMKATRNDCKIDASGDS